MVSQFVVAVKTEEEEEVEMHPKEAIKAEQRRMCWTGVGGPPLERRPCPLAGPPVDPASNCGKHHISQVNSGKSTAAEHVRYRACTPAEGSTSLHDCPAFFSVRRPHNLKRLLRGATADQMTRPHCLPSGSEVASANHVSLVIATDGIAWCCYFPSDCDVAGINNAAASSAVSCEDKFPGSLDPDEHAVSIEVFASPAPFTNLLQLRYPHSNEDSVLVTSLGDNTDMTRNCLEVAPDLHPRGISITKGGVKKRGT
ncbi:hypothetical protein NDU88_000809 [Pleurodeles waltl]|uniref:Uncharacterized protein n=1 Tax=Pleurodeles waltl TaxID=8319 RepID=A0AAV7V946_PLEWA|nr:hypothetical protein NDU88_000809 [Pleurodeles waltl]